MSTDKFQSAIAEVRDQLTVDFSDGTYLNKASANLGMTRPPLGFSDDTWRALVRALAIQPKQVVTAFAAMLEVVFGPHKTVGTTLAVASAVGDQTVRVNDSSMFPQLGTLIFDEGTTAQETVTYNYIDRKENIIYLDKQLAAAHRAYPYDVAATILRAEAGELFVVVDSLMSLDPSLAPFTFVLSAGLPEEETVVATSVDVDSRRLNLGTALANTHTPSRILPISTTLSAAYVTGAPVLYLTSAAKFPSSGVVKVNDSGTLSITGASSTTTLVYTSTPFPDGRGVGNSLTFGAATTTVALRNVTREIIDVEDFASYSILTLDAALPATPAATDTFSIDAILKYTSVDKTSNVLFLELPIFSLSFAAGAVVELISNEKEARLVPVKSQGLNWEVIQSDPRSVEIYLPLESFSYLFDGTLRSASYLHGAATGATTTLSANYTIGTPTMTVVSTASFPLMGVAVLGGTRFSYRVDTATTLLLIGTEDVPSQLAGSAVTAYEPVHTGTLLSGDIWNLPDVFAGPYVYSLYDKAPSPLVATTTVNVLKPSKTLLEASALVGATALEVEDASKFDLQNFPYNIQLGVGFGNQETLRVLDVNLKVRARTTVSVGAGVGVTAITVTNTDMGAAADAAAFPNASRYRVRIGRGTANDEMVLVSSVTPGAPGTLTFAFPTVNAHGIGELVELQSDVLTVDPLGEGHAGAVIASQLTALWPEISTVSRNVQERIDIPTSELSVTSTAGFPAAGTLLLNFGGGTVNRTAVSTVLAAVNATTITAGGGIPFPTSYPYTVIVAPGTTTQEIHRVTNNTGFIITLNGGSFGLKYAHAAGTVLLFISGVFEEVEYTSIVGNTFRFSAPVVLDSDHQVSESVCITLMNSIPSSTGYDFPLRLPVDILTQLQTLLDIIRAAGVEVSLITSR